MRLVRERKRVAWILLLLAVLFAICWLPYNSIQLLVDLKCISQESVSSLIPYALLLGKIWINIEYHRLTSFKLNYCYFLGHMNSAINPIVYCFMTKNFRRSVRKLIRRTPDDLSNRPHQRCKVSINFKHFFVFLCFAATHGLSNHFKSVVILLFIYLI